MKTLGSRIILTRLSLEGEYDIDHRTSKFQGVGVLEMIIPSGGWGTFQIDESVLLIVSV